MKKEQLEKYSAAITLSDMEIFVFPELLFSLVLANLMSPLIWEWRKDPWFDNLDRMKPNRRIMKLKQYIMDHYDFNLDLETWGVTTKESEVERFKPFLSEETISKSNALFGYEGDKYYFDIGIREHFGIDKYNTNIIPFWKTETVEAMDAFKYKKGYNNGAGECVSLSTLYAAAMFVICGIPLEDIFLLATPLHSQNFINIGEGILTNNRRIVTKNMWFNGTELAAKAQRAMRNEQVTIVSNNSGYIHVVYPEATIKENNYNDFKEKIKEFLITDIDSQIFCNFLRLESQYQKCFQLRSVQNGKERYIELEKVFAYEHTSSYRVNDNTRDKLLGEIDEYDFSKEEIEGRIILNEIIDYLDSHKVKFNGEECIEGLCTEIHCPHLQKKEIVSSFFNFCNLTPRLPDEETEKTFVESQVINITKDMTRIDIINYLQTIRENNVTADLAFYAYRDFSTIDWAPFVKAAIERNPVSIEGAKDLSDDEVIKAIDEMEDESIYDGTRIAQPDEIWNFQRGDGIEKAVTLANIMLDRNKDLKITITVEPDFAEISMGDNKVRWASKKGLKGFINIPAV